MSLPSELNFFLILNESSIGESIDVYNTLERFKKEGLIGNSKIYSYLTRRREGASDALINKEILMEAEKLQPHVILWRHTGNLKIENSTIENLRKMKSFPSMGYLDGDIYKRFYYPMPKEIVELCKNCDVCFWVGHSKEIISRLEKSGCHDIRYVPSSTDEYTFSEGRQSPSDPEYDVVMVGNLLRYRMPFKTLSGTKFREKLADFFYAKLGPKFAVFGKGWKAEYCKGPIEFKQQNKVYQNSRIVLGTNNINADYYFSNRLPITLSCGSIIVHNYEKGYEEIFPKSGYNYFYKSVEEAWDISERILKKPQAEIDEEALTFRNYALQEFSMYKKLTYILEVLGDYKKARDTNEKPVLRSNPWISSSRLTNKPLSIKSK